ncbi:hypothetical protein BRARA_H01808 [Brassica rapa]|uniref:Uncharacterized protein n=1 Tax=Brassica campestris TaxID=3711 RepID=A0A397YCD4_BRACM|nr:hypothetical protein BRARA_H01808 [Brassica rapa]
MEVIGFTRETEVAFSETEMEAAEQLVHGTSWSISEGGSNAKRHENVVNSESYDMVGKKKNNGVRMMHKNVTDGQSFVTAIKETNIIIRRNKKKKFRFLASIYRATNEMR